MESYFIAGTRQNIEPERLRPFIKDGHLTVTVVPNARQAVIKVTQQGLKIYVTCVPEDGKANRAVAEILSKSLRCAPSELTLVRGQKSRQKTFRLESRLCG